MINFAARHDDCEKFVALFSRVTSNLPQLAPHTPQTH